MNGENLHNEILVGERRGLKRLTPCALLVGLALVCVAMTGILPHRLQAVAVVIISCLLCAYDGVFLLYPVMIFYSGQLGLLLGISVFRIFSLLVLGNFVFRRCTNGSARLQHWNVLPCVIYVLYCLLVVSSRTMRTGVFALVDIMCCTVISANYLMDEASVKSFFTVYIFSALAAYLTGMLYGNAQDYSGAESIAANTEFSRFMATFEDPNYMGFFYTIAIWALIALKLFTPKLRWPLVIILYVILLSSASITAIVANIVLWFVYLVVLKKLNVKTLLAVVAVAIVLAVLYDYGLKNPNSKILGLASLRIREKLISWEQGNMTEVTTGRTDLSVEHLEFFWRQPLWRLLIGGYEVNRYHVTPGIHGAAHNEYIDLLLNVGLLGTLVMLGSFVTGGIVYWRRFRKKRDSLSLFKFLCKIVWAIYAAGLTIFLDHRFLFPFLF